MRQHLPLYPKCSRGAPDSLQAFLVQMQGHPRSLSHPLPPKSIGVPASGRMAVSAPQSQCVPWAQLPVSSGTTPCLPWHNLDQGFQGEASCCRCQLQEPAAWLLLSPPLLKQRGYAKGLPTAKDRIVFQEQGFSGGQTAGLTGTECGDRSRDRAGQELSSPEVSARLPLIHVSWSLAVGPL